MGRLMMLAVATGLVVAMVVVSPATPATAAMTKPGGGVAETLHSGTGTEDKHPLFLSSLSSRKRCIIARCRPCGGSGGSVRNGTCAAGSKCLENRAAPGRAAKTCAVIGFVGSVCNTGCTVCGDGLVCASNGRCVKRACIVSRCGRCGGTRKCAGSGMCLGGFCRSSGLTGQRCSAACGGCGRGLSCKSGVCGPVVKPAPRVLTIDRCGRCDYAGKCTASARCTGGFCRSSGSTGQRCSAACGGCGRGLSCKSGVCGPVVKPAPRVLTIDRCGRCGYAGKCTASARCTGGFCRSSGSTSQRCSAACGGCGRGLSCKSGVCGPVMKPVPVPVAPSGRCGQCGGGRGCVKGTACVGGTCTSAGRAGNTCSTACGTCAEALECGVEGFCEASLDDWDY
ncbi:hypothetical protein I4F81_009456 [Pyropia yezoensis]|uniref:Uncharacterized protein n=1 Tax=Pyropia yezoensis TaxID=2788 RepID=A0ACC3C9H2_PYRYE|nr:hypothetical protein I4F81_009456 [Neopyropia yezoensis]